MSSNRKQKLKLYGLGAMALVFLAFFVYDPLHYTYTEKTLAPTFEEFYAARLEASKIAGVRPGTEERLLRIAPGQTDWAILYIHGFGASRGEGEIIVDQLAKKWHANTYYMRLPGHITTTEDHATHTYTEYLDSAEETLRMMPQLGKHILIIGTSTGGTLATHLAAQHPERVQALILASPFFEFKTASAILFQIPGGLTLGKLVLGEDRNAGWDDPRKHPEYEKHWLIEQKLDALGNLNDLRAYVAHKNTYQKITAPVMMLYYYKDEEHQDNVIDIKAALEAFHQFGTLKSNDLTIKPNPLNRAVAVADGNHILLSEFVRTDKDFIIAEINRFLAKVVNQP